MALEGVKSMTFVNEAVSEEDAKNTFFTRPSPFPGQGPTLRPNQWTIDRDRDFILHFGQGGTRGEPDRFAYQWQGRFGVVMGHMGFSVVEPLKDRPGYLTDFTWTMFLLCLPVECPGQKIEIQQLLTEAFKVYGAHYGGSAARNVAVVWDTCRVCVGGGICPILMICLLCCKTPRRQTISVSGSKNGVSKNGVRVHFPTADALM